MMKYILRSLPLVLIGLGIWFAFSIGFFKEVRIYQSKMGPYVMVFKDHTGPYHYIGKAIAEVERWTSVENISCSKSFGEYIDRPDNVEHERLRSRGGCLLQEKPASHVPSDLQLIERSEADYVVAEFEGSPSLGPYKVYNKIEQYFLDNRLKLNGPVIEIYETRGEQHLTTYLFPYISE